MSDYCGRFAPSPTGDLHLGSLVAALASYAEAKKQQGRWLLRIEDIDMPRTEAGADQRIIDALAQFGFVWDGDIRYQSQHISEYQAALEQLKQQDRVYPCACKRKPLRRYNEAKQLPLGLYPGFCRHARIDTDKPHSWRIKVPQIPLTFQDSLCGAQTENLSQSCGDFILKRTDKLFSYQLAVVVDDAAQAVTDIIRGQDLLDSTNRQQHIQQCLEIPEPRYAHIPLVKDNRGRKLSKQNHAPALDLTKPTLCLWQALDYLRQSPPESLKTASLDTIWQWLWQHWDINKCKT